MAKTAAKKPAPIKKSFWQNDAYVGLLLAGFAFLLFIQTVGFDFALDDMAVVYKNNYVGAGFGGFGKILSTFYWNGCPDFASANSGLFRPVSLLLFAMEWQFAPNSSHFFHTINLILFSVCVYQLYRFLRELLRNESMTLAFMATALWIALPVHVEVNANIKSADEILSLLFSLLAFRKLLLWSDNGKMAPLLLAAFYMFVALLSKEGVVLLIPVMLLALFMFRGKTIKQLLLPGAFLAVVAIVWFAWHFAVIANAGTDLIKYDYRNNALLSSASAIDRVGTAIGMQARYWLKMLVGYPLSYNYSFNEIPVDGFASVWTWISLAGIFAAGYFTWRNFKKTPVVSFAILFYFITFALTCNIFYLIGDTFAERLTYVPSIGFVLLLSWLILKFTNGLNEKRFHPPAVYVMTALLLFYSIRSFSRAQDWEYDKFLFTSDVEHAPNSARVHDNYGVLLMNNAHDQKDEVQKRQFFDQAYEQFKLSAGIDSNDFQASVSLAEIEFNRGNYRAAIHWGKKNLDCFDRFWHVPPVDKAVYFILANSYISVQQYDSARVVLARAEKQFPNDDNVLVTKGNSFLAQHDTLNAFVSLEKAVQINPKSAVAWDKLGNLHGMRGEYEKSNEAFQQLIAIDPKNPAPYAGLKNNALFMHDTAKAQEFYDKYKQLGGQ